MGILDHGDVETQVNARTSSLVAERIGELTLGQARLRAQLERTEQEREAEVERADKQFQELRNLRAGLNGLRDAIREQAVAAAQQLPDAEGTTSLVLRHRLYQAREHIQHIIDLVYPDPEDASAREPKAAAN